MLITEGLAKLEVGEMSTAILTGGGCNWKWFQDEIGAHELYAQRVEQSVLHDEKPELTIARGLARVYSIGTYSRRLIDQVAAAREQLLQPLREIHAGLLDKLTSALAARMTADRDLDADIRHIFMESLTRAAEAKPIHSTPRLWFQEIWDRLKQLWADLARIFSRPVNSNDELQQQIKSAFQQMLKDPEAEAVRPALERRIRDWLAANRTGLGALDEEIASAAHPPIMELFKLHLDIGGLVEVAIEACSATGDTTFDVALKELGKKVDFGPGMIDRMSEWVEMIVRATAGEESKVSKADLERQAATSTARFFAALGTAIRKNVAQVQPAETWARNVVDDLTATLETLARVARVDQAPRPATTSTAASPG